MDPLCELAGLCNEQGEIMYLRLHPLQDMVGKEYLQKILYRCFITVVNAVGVDINKAAAHKHGSFVLQFVAGLGPVKAAALLDSIFREGGKLMLRESLEHMVGPRCFINCAGFIRIFDKYFTRLNEDLNPLDNTRYFLLIN
jgi:transcription elongation factor SPT6